MRWELQWEFPWSPAAGDAYIRKFYEKLLPPTAAHYASMREDLKKKRRTEIDALNGCIVRFGEEHEIPCPANALLTALIHGPRKKQWPAIGNTAGRDFKFNYHEAQVMSPISCS